MRTRPLQFFCLWPAVQLWVSPSAVGDTLNTSARQTLTVAASVTQASYRALRQPPLYPPGWVFGPVWTALYATMGYTAYRAWTTGSTSINPQTVALAKQGATLYSIQLALNLIWTPLYFGMGRPIAATVDIIALGGTVGYLAYIWGQVDPTCGWLLAPYLGWLSFATYLCVSTSQLVI